MKRLSMAILCALGFLGVLTSAPHPLSVSAQQIGPPTKTIDQLPTYPGPASAGDPIMTKHSGITSQATPAQLLIPSLFNPPSALSAAFGGVYPYSFPSGITLPSLASAPCLGTNSVGTFVLATCGSGVITSVTAGDSTVVIGGTAWAPTVKVAQTPALTGLTLSGLAPGLPVCTDSLKNLATAGCQSSGVALSATNNGFIQAGTTQNVLASAGDLVAESGVTAGRVLFGKGDASLNHGTPMLDWGTLNNGFTFGNGCTNSISLLVYCGVDFSSFIRMDPQGTATSGGGWPSSLFTMQSSFWNGSAAQTREMECSFDQNGTFACAYILFPRFAYQMSAGHQGMYIYANASATAGGNVNSDYFTLQGNTWNGSASATDNWTLQNVMGTGASAPGVLNFEHGFVTQMTLDLNGAAAHKKMNQMSASQFATRAALVAGSLTFSFPVAYSSIPVCTATGEGSTVNVLKIVPSTTNANVTSSAGGDTQTVDIICVGNPN